MDSDKINPRNPNPNKLNLFRGKKIEIGTVVGVKDIEENKFYYGQITDIFDNNMVRVAYYKETDEETRVVNLTNPNDVRPQPTGFGGPLDVGELSWEAQYELENTFKKASKSKKRKRGSKKRRRSRKKKKKKQTKKKPKKPKKR